MFHPFSIDVGRCSDVVQQGAVQSSSVSLKIRKRIQSQNHIKFLHSCTARFELEPFEMLRTRNLPCVSRFAPVHFERVLHRFFKGSPVPQGFNSNPL